MAGNVIDSLVVTLGLDSKEFAQGVKGSTEQLAGFTRRLAGMFLAVRGLEDVVGYFKDLHHTLAEVGFTARNLGVAGTEIKKLGEVSELFGGQVNDAADSIQNLQSAVFNLRYRGQLADSLLMLQRFGVAYLTASGHARNFNDIALDAARAIERQAKAAGLTQGERYQMALSFGFTGGIASAVAQGSGGFSKAFDRATKDQKPLSERTIQAQVQLSRDLTSLSEHTDALNSALLSKMTPLIEGAVHMLGQLVNDLIPKLIKALTGVIDFFKHPPAWFAGIEGAVKGMAEVLGPTGTLIAALGALTVAVGAGGALVSALGGLGLVLSAGVGVGALVANLPSGGLLDKLNEKFLDWFGPGSDQDFSKTPPPPRARFGVIPRPPATPTAPRPAPAPAQSAAAGTPTAMLTGPRGGTQVHIENMEVNTRATDAEGIAGSIGGALQRKLLVANADSGLA